MTINRNTLLAGVATLALIAGTGLASAQEQQKHPGAPQANQPHATAPANNHAAPAMKPQGANRAAPTPGPAAQQNPKENRRVGQSAAQPGATPNGRHAQSVNRGNKANNEGMTAQERHIPRGLQSNASGQMQGQHELSAEQRTQIRRTVIDARGAPRVGHVDFDVSVGTAIPRGRVHIVPIPETLVRIDPGWRGFLYFIYEDEVVIVDPHDMRIVAILPV
jgi:Protein of unknown function (DUF1236)